MAAFSNEFKSEECVKRLKTILNLLEEDKDEALKCKAGNDNSEKGDIVEAEHKEAERVEAEHKETERVEAECKETESVEAEHKETESVEAEHKKEAKRVKAECKKEAETVEAESTETEMVEAECKTEELCKENPVDKKQRKMDRELYLVISKKILCLKMKEKVRNCLVFLKVSNVIQKQCLKTI